LEKNWDIDQTLWLGHEGLLHDKDYMMPFGFQFSRNIWHALATVWACQAGKDVYVEKKPSINIWEGRKWLKQPRIQIEFVQVGFQTRSALWIFLPPQRLYKKRQTW